MPNVLYTGHLRVHLYIGLVHTHRVTSSEFQFALFNCQPYHIIMAFASCQEEHCVTMVGHGVEQGVYLRCQVPYGIYMATLCSMVERIPSILQKGKQQVNTCSNVHFVYDRK